MEIKELVNDGMRHFTCLIKAISDGRSADVLKEIDTIQRLLDKVGEQYGREKKL